MAGSLHPLVAEAVVEVAGAVERRGGAMAAWRTEVRRGSAAVRELQ